MPAAVAGIAAVIAMGREAHHPTLDERFAGPLSPPPKDPTPLQAMDHRLQTPGRQETLRLTQKQILEPVFGIIKSVLGFRQFLLRGLDNVRGEWNLVTMAYVEHQADVRPGRRANWRPIRNHSTVNRRRWPARCESRQHHLSSNRFCPFESPQTPRTHAVATNDRQSLASSHSDRLLVKNSRANFLHACPVPATSQNQAKRPRSRTPATDRWSGGNPPLVRSMPFLATRRSTPTVHPVRNWRQPTKWNAAGDPEG